MSDIPNPRQDEAVHDAVDDEVAARPGPGAEAGSAEAEARRPARVGRYHRRREKIVAEIERNRRGEFRVPTWVLVLILLALVGGWLAFVLAI